MKIILGISSGIAAYKIPELAKKLVKKGHDVHVIMTSKSSYLVSPEELEEITGNEVFIQLFDKNFSKEKILRERKVDHIELAKTAEMIVIAPATANTIANLASGKADDFLSTTILATRAPILICPSMNNQMWLHPAVQENIQRLESFGYIVMTPEEGALACGTEGIGRLPSIDTIAAYIEELIEAHTLLKGKKILLTSGPTEESIDAARVITNKSSGKMGIALAEECFRRGAHVMVLRANKSKGTHYPVSQCTFTTAQELANLLHEYAKDFDMIIHTAAVSDFTVDTSPGKIDSAQEIQITLKPTEKIINKLKQWNPKALLIGFKAIVGTVEDNKEKIQKVFMDSKADYIVVNDISRVDIGFESNDNEVTIIDNTGKQEKIDKMSKQDIARHIVDRIKI